ncbi:D-alanine--D-alanine ligase [Candidatus Solincola tengchongensis]|uniref:D-alanine--D-alanine ligase n=1 Tax=Candidatus Solincola tengchongensis TaxID=2900693 RepID=UPI00257DE9B9|nr:D-alanine--D-alanine ligase [Candidatus Solincola tengchongensis]
MEIELRRVAVIMGGVSAEREVSLRSGAAVAAALRELGYRVLEVDLGPSALEQLTALRSEVDAAFLALHGRLGEDGTVQGALELLGVPYTGSGVLASALAMDKRMSKRVFRSEGIPVAEDVTITAADVRGAGLRRVAEGIALDLGFPCMVKPAGEGSTLGSSRASNTEELEEALREALGYDEVVLVERYIRGRELTVGLLGEEPEALPVLEIVASKGVYDYECKYTKGMTEYLVPAPIPDKLAAELQRLAVKAHRALGCEGVSRVDFMVDGEGRAYCLEVNTLPGMTELSLVPKAAAAAGYSFKEMVERILRTARLKVGRRGFAGDGAGS